MAREKFQSVRGMYDILPDKQPLFRLVTDTFRHLADNAGYSFIETPLVEATDLFVRGVGTGTDVVDKEIYSFEDRSGNMIALRPEPTAGVARAYIQNGMASMPQPVKLAITGPMFRYDRPQAGRQRQFWQIGVEVFGEASPSADAQVIVLADRLYRKLGLKGTKLLINSIGDLESRQAYRDALVQYLQAHKTQIDEIDRERITTNPLRVLDSKSPRTAKVLEHVPKILDYLNAKSKAHFEQVLAYLDSVGVTYELNHLLVRGLDYYTDTVFEFVGARDGQQASLGGGGRYDGLVELLGGKPTPAVGFGLGVERILLELEALDIEIPAANVVDVFVAAIGEDAQAAGFSLTEKLLNEDIATTSLLGKSNVGMLLSKADKLGAKFAILIGDKELAEGTITLRDMKTGDQVEIPADKAVAEVVQRLG